MPGLTAGADPRSYGRRSVGAVAGATALGVPVALVARTALAGAAVRRAYPRLGQMVEGDGVALHCVVSGQGRPVVLLHGNPGTVHSFLPAFPTLLGQEYQVVAIDRPGHGHSPRLCSDGGSPIAQANAVRAALRRLGVHHPIVVAHSWSGALALWWATEFPSEVAGLVLAEATFYDEPKLLDPVYRLLAPPSGAALAWTVGPLLSRPRIAAGLVTAWAPMPVPPEVVARSVALWSRPADLRAVAGDALARAALISSLSPRWPQVACPTVIVACPDDRYVDPARHSYRLHGELPESLLFEVPGAGHALPDARPDAVVAAIGVVSRMIGAAHGYP